MSGVPGAVALTLREGRVRVRGRRPVTNRVELWHNGQRRGAPQLNGCPLLNMDGLCCEWLRAPSQQRKSRRWAMDAYNFVLSVNQCRKLIISKFDDVQFLQPVERIINAYVYFINIMSIGRKVVIPYIIIWINKHLHMCMQP